MSKKLADATLNGRWSQSSDMESFKDITSTEPDATRAKKRLEESQGKEGKEWVGGKNAVAKDKNQSKLLRMLQKLATTCKTSVMY